MEKVYIIKNGYGGVRYYGNTKVFEKQLIKLKYERDTFQTHPDTPKLEVYYADNEYPLHLIESYP